MEFGNFSGCPNADAIDFMANQLYIKISSSLRKKIYIGECHMIFYFSATGNSKYVATRIAAKTNDRLFSISDCYKNRAFLFELNAGEAVGIISPVFFLGLPTIADSFISQLRLNGAEKPYTYFVATYGTTAGQSAAFVKQHLETKGLSLSACFCVRMPDTWTPAFDLSDSEKVRKINERAETQIDAVISHITKAERGDFIKARIPMLVAKAFLRLYEKQRETKRFIVEDSCMGCGLCAEKCPAKAIEIRTGRPVWVTDKCVLCLGCLHRCPAFSIQNGSNTKKHGQYQNPHVKV